MRDTSGKKGTVMKSSHNQKPKEMGIGERFQQDTKYDPRDMGGHFLDWSKRPEPYKNYDPPLAIVAIPELPRTEKADLWHLLSHRRSRRVYETGGTIKAEHLSALLWATQGITARYGEFLFRTAPSAGGLYPIETYLLIRAVEGLEPGIYHFRPQAFDLELILRGDHSKELAEAALGQMIVREAQATFIWSAVTARSKWKYRQRVYRYIYLDAGHIAENLYLAGEALGLGVCGIGALFDDMVNELVGLDGFEETVIYMATVGRARKGGAYMDLTQFSKEELFASAIKSEVESREVYSGLAEKVKNAFLKDRLSFLASEEEKHRAFLEGAFQREFPGRELVLPQKTPVPLPEVRISDEMAPLSEVLESAMGAELASQEFYNSFAAEFPEGTDMRKTLELFATMEMGHYRILEMERDNMKRFESYDAYWPMIHVGS